MIMDYEIMSPTGFEPHRLLATSEMSMFMGILPEKCFTFKWMQ
jgi:hypothetical protein